MPNVMVALSNLGGALYSTPQTFPLILRTIIIARMSTGEEGVFKNIFKTLTKCKTHAFSGLFLQDSLGKPAPERLNQSGFYWSKR